VPILDEVEIFLEKHVKVSTDSKRFIDTLKFIKEDVTGLKAKLTNHLLQVSLVSPTRYYFR
jgi:hypothetical protein